MQANRLKRSRLARIATVFLVWVMVFPVAPMGFSVAPAQAAPGDVFQTPVVPMELPIEVEIELSPAGSLKQALLWK